MPDSRPDQLLRRAGVSRRFQLFAVRLLGLQTATAKAVFCGESGEVSAEGEQLLALLAQEARLNRHGFNGDADRRLFDAGAQHIVRTLIDWTEADSGKIARAQQRLKDEANGKD